MYHSLSEIDTSTQEYQDALSQAQEVITSPEMTQGTQRKPKKEKPNKQQRDSLWLSQDPLGSLSLPEDEAKIITKADTQNRETERSKQNEEIKKEFDSLHMPLRAAFLKESLNRELSMSWQERSAYTHQCNLLGAQPTVVQRQRLIRDRESAAREHVFDMQNYEAFRLTPQDTVRKTANGQPQLCRSPLASLVTGLNSKTKEIVSQTYPERIGAMVKGITLAETHKKLNVPKWRVAALKQFAHFQFHSTAIQYNLYQGLLRTGAFSKMGQIGALFAQSMGLLLVENIKQNEALIKCFDKEEYQNLIGKRYLDLHPGSAPKDWYLKEQSEARALPKVPLPHPQCNYAEWMSELKKLGFGGKPKQQKTTATSEQGKGTKRPNPTPPTNPTKKNKKQKKKKSKKGTPFWKRRAWVCSVCETLHPKGHYCKAGIEAGPPKATPKAN